MSRTNDPNAPLSLDTPIDEDRVRRALGLKSNAPPHQQRPEQARQRHRFVADGAVPVVMLNRADNETSGLKERLAAAESALEHERSMHAATKRALQEASAANQVLQTRAHHTELAHNEVLAVEREARRQAEERLQAALAQQAERPPSPPEKVAAPKPDRVARKPRAAAAPREQKPVRWWTPSFRAKQG